jgi:U3 small nucleolar RNA-associated protein 12
MESLFASNRKHVFIGTKKGGIETIDFVSGLQAATVKAHRESIWTMCLVQTFGFITGSADCRVKVWRYRQESHETNEPSIKIHLQCTLLLTNAPLCIRVSQTGLLLAISLLDSTIKVFRFAKMEFYGSIYDHYLPSISLDFSSDEKILVSGGSEMRLRVWDLDWNNSRKSILAHQKTITQVSLVPNTHRCFSAGKDGIICFWDCDKLELLLSVNVHYGEVWALAIAHLNHFVISTGHDRSIRRWDFKFVSSFKKRMDQMYVNSPSKDFKCDLINVKTNRLDLLRNTQSLFFKSIEKFLSNGSRSIGNLHHELLISDKTIAKRISDAQFCTRVNGMDTPLYEVSPGGHSWGSITRVLKIHKSFSSLTLCSAFTQSVIFLLGEWLNSFEHVDVAVRLSLLLLCSCSSLYKQKSDANVKLRRLKEILHQVYKFIKITVNFNLVSLNDLTKRLKK